MTTLEDFGNLTADELVFYEKNGVARDADRLKKRSEWGLIEWQRYALESRFLYGKLFLRMKEMARDIAALEAERDELRDKIEVGE